MNNVPPAPKAPPAVKPPRADDSFERRFALEQAVAFAATPSFKPGNAVPSQVVIGVADRFLGFLKGGPQ